MFIINFYYLIKINYACCAGIIKLKIYCAEKIEQNKGGRQLLAVKTMNSLELLTSATKPQILALDLEYLGGWFP
jgi:hypothetical protein